MRMVGREQEFALLVDMLNRAEAGAGGFAVLTGEAGIGKTRLVTEWAAEARRRGFVVLMGRAIDSGGSLRPVAQALMEAVRNRALLEAPALRPFRAALGRVLPGIVAEEPIASTIDPTVVLGEGILRLLRSVGGSGTLLLLEDLHWADPDTLALLDSLGGPLSTSPIIVAATVRDNSPGESTAADLLAAAGDRGAAAEIRLRQVGRDITRGAMRSAEQRLEQLAEEAVLPVRVAMERVRLYTLIGDANRALEVGASALDLSTGDDHAELCLRLARAAIIARRWKEAEESVGQVGRPDDARSSVLLAEAAHGAGRIDVALNHANRAIERSEGDQHPEVLCEALCIMGRLARLSDPLPPRQRSVGPVRSLRSSGSGRGVWRPDLGLVRLKRWTRSCRRGWLARGTWRWTVGYSCRPVALKSSSPSRRTSRTVLVRS